MFNILDLFFPRSNKNYSSIHTYLTKKEIQQQKPSLKPLNKTQRKYIKTVFSASYFDNDIINDLISRVKFDKETAIIDSFSDLIYEKIFIECDYFIPDPDVIIPVASDRNRDVERGFSLPQILAKKLSKKIKNCDYFDILIKKQSTTQQTKLNKKDRIKNLTNKITIIKNTPNLSNKNIVWLIDDVSTTGTTLVKNAQTLKKLYPFIDIYGIVIAR
jgi:ComF family protein